MRASQYFKNTNFMTPNIMQYFDTLTLAIELSKGRGIMGQPIFGVSVVEKARPEDTCKLSKLFQSEYAARKYIDKLKAFVNCNYTVESMLYELSSKE